MPTGYTADVADGKITTLRDFALTCARGMGALIMMRDEPFSAPIPERFEPSDYHAKELKRIDAELAALQAMNPDDWQVQADKQLAEQVASAQRYAQSKVEQRARYDAMLAQTEAWQGAPEGLKEFMLSQLRESRQFDCPEDTGSWNKPPVALTGQDWRSAREAALLKDRAYHAKAAQEEFERTEGRNRWIKQLREALPAEVSEPA